MGSDNFSSTVDLLKGFYVNLYVGEEIIKGKLMGVETDHIIIEDENQYVYYYSIDKIQAITKNTKQYKGEDITTEFMQTQSLADLLSSLKNSWVSILCLNKQSFTGVLSIVDADFVTLINGEDRILIKISHISNILKGYRKEEKQEENKNETESAVSESNTEDTNDNYVETQVFVKQESNLQQPVVANIIENDAVVSPKVSVNQPETEKRVWTEPVKNSLPVAKISNDIKIVKEEKKQNAHNESIPQNVRQNSHIESKWSKTELPQTHQEEVKKQKSEVVIQNIVKHDKESIQKPTSSKVDKRVQVKQPVREQKKSEPETKNEGTAKSPQELINKVKQVKETIDTNPLMKIEKTKRNQVESKKEDKKPKAQEVGASRFSGEPATRDFDRRSIFSGWPNRNQSQKRI
ncbi:hypothetical protein [Bacillus sp. 7884-1]|uniref:hypothetical protein n=1 Tax=Bacillus sp. 7884-1 TaxID=2021693 RepID=UPI000BA5108A|nr:hypothetical protein [Bacillus sp. 7884-1]PAE44039.1 hypothetical protein CHI06_03130 [Bacillus sp. 7884-1]